MDAFGSAFDIVIVGALALPWVLLVIHLIFSDTESSLGKLLVSVKQQNQPALVSVLLFAMAYPMGSAVSRIAQDFFDDDDLHLHVSISGYERWFRLPVVTETSIRTDVYCQAQEPTPRSTLSDTGPQFAQPPKPNQSLCQYAGGRLTPKTADVWSGRAQLEELATHVFHIQEAALLLLGTDDNERLRQFRAQIIVLRGAAFNGMVAFSLCLFWWCRRFQSRLRWTAPLACSFLGAVSLYNHLLERPASDPPYMEFTLLVLAATGWYLLWKPAQKAKAAGEETPPQNGRGRIQPAYLVLAAFLTATAFLGWWSTQVLYDQQVFYSYQAMTQTPKPATPSQK